MRPKDIMQYSVEDRRRYLNNSIVSVDGEPVMVMEVERDFIHAIPLATPSEAKRMSLKTKEWNFDPVPLGFFKKFRPFSDNREAGILRRAPYRAWKIGLNSSNCRIANVDFTGNRSWTPSFSGVPNTNALCSPYIADCIKGHFASFEDILKESLKPGDVAPFSRTYALYGSKTSSLLLHNILGRVGTVSQDGDFVLDNDKMFLIQDLEENVK